MRRLRRRTREGAGLALLWSKIKKLKFASSFTSPEKENYFFIFMLWLWSKKFINGPVTTTLGAKLKGTQTVQRSRDLSAWRRGEHKLYRCFTTDGQCFHYWSVGFLLTWMNVLFFKRCAITSFGHGLEVPGCFFLKFFEASLSSSLFFFYFIFSSSSSSSSLSIPSLIFAKMHAF